MQLSPLQQKDVENSLWVVNSALKQQGLSNNEDLRQSAILYMCECRLRFDPQKHIRWTTYAYRNVYLYIKKVVKRERKLEAKFVNKDIFDMEDYFKCEKPKDSQMFTYQAILKTCDKEDIIILELIKQGYSRLEIAKALNCSQSKIYKRFRAIKQRVNGLKNN